MNIAIEDINSCRKRLKIELPANEVNEEIERITNEFQKQAKLPGFRAGKVPRDVISKRFSEEIDEETKRSLVPKAYRRAIQEKKLRVVSSPSIEDLKFQRGLSLSFSTLVDLAPEIRLPEYKGLSLPKIDDTLTEEEFEKQLNQLREHQAHFHDLTGRPTQTDDFAVIDYTATVDGKPLLEIAPEAKKIAEQKNLWIKLEEDAFLPKFGGQLVGMNIGDKKEITVEFPENFPYPELVGKKAIFSVEMKSIKEKHLPELDEDFAQNHFKMSLEQVKTNLREGLQTQKKNDIVAQQKNQLLEQLLNKTDFDLPESLLAAQTKNVVREIVEHNQQRGISLDAIQDKKDEIYQTAQKSARERVKAAFLLLQIAQKENLQVTTEEMNHRIHHLSHQYGMEPQKFLEELNKHNGLNQIEEELLISKTLDFLLTHAKVE
ncbi:MAG: trigger factor [Verrucomicrobiae bacterium]|nr:trigger factor [Verrucomicrobiae bacterium]